MSEHIPLGWMCPRCGRVWAPGVLSCLRCEPAEVAAETGLLAALAADPGWVATLTDEALRVEQVEVQDESGADGG